MANLLIQPKVNIKNVPNPMINRALLDEILSDATAVTKVEVSRLEAMKNDFANVVYTMAAISEFGANEKTVMLGQKVELDAETTEIVKSRYLLSQYKVTKEFEIFLTPRAVKIAQNPLWANLKVSRTAVKLDANFLDPFEFADAQTRILAGFGKEAKFAEDLDHGTGTQLLASVLDCYKNGNEIHVSDPNKVRIPVVLRSDLFDKDFNAVSVTYSSWKYSFKRAAIAAFSSSHSASKIPTTNEGNKPKRKGKNQNKKKVISNDANSSKEIGTERSDS